KLPLSTSCPECDVSGCGYSRGRFMIASGLWPGALGGTRTSNLQIRRYLSGVQHGPDRSASWHDRHAPVRVRSLSWEVVRPGGSRVGSHHRIPVRLSRRRAGATARPLLRAGGHDGSGSRGKEGAPIDPTRAIAVAL